MIFGGISVITESGEWIGDLYDMKPDDNIATLLERARQLLTNNSIIIRPSAYFAIQGVKIDETLDGGKDFGDFGINPLETEDKPTEIVFYDPALHHSYV